MGKMLLKFFLFLFLAIIFAFGGYAFFYARIFNKLENKITSSENGDQSLINTLRSLTSGDPLSIRGFSDGRVNILLLGIAGKGKPGQNLTDTIIVASLNTKTNQVALLSIPRDFYAKIPSLGLQTKINSVYQIGLGSGDEKNAQDLIRKTIEEITSLEIHYIAILNFEGFEKAIDAVDGINIMNERDLYDPRYPGPNYSYETFELKQGFQHLDGKTALKYARERHNDPDGDFGRAKRQQQVMEAFKNKIFSLSSLLDAFAMNDLAKSLGDNLKTDISSEEIGEFLKLSKKLDTRNINNIVFDAWNPTSLLKVSHVFFGESRAFVLVPRVGNYSEIQETAENIFDLNKIKRKKEEISTENARVAILNASGDAGLLGKIKKLLEENFGYKNLSIINATSKNTSEISAAYDLTEKEKPFTLSEIAQKLPAQISYNLRDDLKSQLIGSTPDVLVVLGKDLLELYNMEEDSLEDYKNFEDTNEYTEFLTNKPEEKKVKK